MKRQLTRVLTADAQAERDEFDAEESGCSCHLSPPCGYCTHPGNPESQENDDSAWRMVDLRIVRNRHRAAFLRRRGEDIAFDPSIDAWTWQRAVA